MNTNVDVGDRGSEAVAASLCLPRRSNAKAGRGAPSGVAPLEHAETRHGRASSAVEQRDREFFEAGSANMNDSGQQPARIRILVLEEQPLLRQGISAYLNSQPDMMVCCEAGSLSEARSKIAEGRPQVLVTPLRLGVQGVQDTLKFIKKVKTENPRLRLLVYSAYEETVFAERAMRAGANGYVMKQGSIEKLTIAIRDIVKGGIYVSQEMALNAFRKSLQRRRKNSRALRSATNLENLSDREMHVFQLLGSGLRTRQIAASLELSVKTIDAHRENIKHKLRLGSCAELRECAARWVEQNLSAEEHVFRGAGHQPKLPLVAPVTTET